MIRLKCEACGSTDLKRSGYKYICDYCGSKYFFNEDDQEVDSELTDVRVLELLDLARNIDIKLFKINIVKKRPYQIILNRVLIRGVTY